MRSLKPTFARLKTDGPSGAGSLHIKHDKRAGLDGWFELTVPVTPGQSYHWQVWRKTTGVADPRRSALVRILWRDQQNRPVLAERTDLSVPHTPSAEPDHPTDGTPDHQGWTRFRRPYRFRRMRRTR